mmetsp:Transcript_27066/g.56925  ORF Transcript_27066/g.56925 Transcript_27066/m.56925 type:complete len:156 (-) Transcript_27066:211-678(-)|eukprot:CAMPEP_0171347766 /NCGR_PEP_ID=MMETSP0878-20121228/28933_1 /TAXON_ID=67004 /ORGANISM="Thalassiosira weissflogii, Strain CCMP1336" /LENGTH=155 /DNA_ID=CAMNT_0011851903 /DNA_START=109 /DNA_END=576 /DNA_ORIENTATION=-
MADKNMVKFNEATNTELAFRCISNNKNHNMKRFLSPNFSLHGFYSIILGIGPEGEEIHHNPTVDMPLSDDSAISTNYDLSSADGYDEATILRFLSGNSVENPQDAAESFHESSDDDNDILDEYLNGIKDELDIYWQKGCSFRTRNEDRDIGYNDL